MSPQIEAGRSGIAVEELRERIDTARDRSHREYIEQHPPIAELPAGIYDTRQRERYIKVDNNILSSVSKVMAELGINNFHLVRDFRRASQYPKDKHMSYQIRYRRGEKEED